MAIDESAPLEALKTRILLLLVTKGMNWLGGKFVEKVQGDKPSAEEVQRFFDSGLDEDKARDLLKGYVNDLVKSVEARFQESELDSPPAVCSSITQCLSI